MHKEYVYTSVFSRFINDYIALHRDAGFMYDNPSYWLYRFDQYCVNESVNKPVVTKSLYEAWASKSETETKTTQNNRLQALKNFSLYLCTLGVPSYVPQSLPRPEKTVPYLMKDDDIREFFEQVDHYETLSLAKPFQRMACEYKVLFRLIYCCGLRNNEACSLKTENVDTDSGIISIHQSKGRKDRIVYLADDLRDLCLHYRHWLVKQFDSPSEWFFPGKYPEGHILKTSVDRKFNDFWSGTDISKTCDKKPTVHCLRHAFVIKRINTWMESDISLQEMVPYLSNYLGHNSPLETYYYFHQVEDAFHTVRRKDLISSRIIPEVLYEE